MCGGGGKRQGERNDDRKTFNWSKENEQEKRKATGEKNEMRHERVFSRSITKAKARERSRERNEERQRLIEENRKVNGIQPLEAEGKAMHVVRKGQTGG